MENDLFDVGGDEPTKPLPDAVKNLMIKEITEEILNKESYRQSLLNTPSTYSKTIDFLENALIQFEEEENYEVCSKLAELKKEILKKLL